MSTSKIRRNIYRKLTHVDLEVSRQCNLKCIHCSAASKNRGKEMPLNIIKRILREAKSMGLQKVGLTGGEPFLNRKKLMRIAYFCRNELNIPVHIHSNGTLISKQDARWIKNIDAEISIAFYGSTPSIHDNITGITGSFSSTLLGLKKLIAEKAELCIYFVPMKQNFHSVKSLIKMVYNMGVKHARILILSPTGRAKPQFDNLALSKKDAQEFNKELLDVKQKTKIEIINGFCTSQIFSGLDIMQGHEQCFAAENRIHIDAFGNVFPCTASSGIIIFSSGNVQTPGNSLKSIWNDSPIFQFFRSSNKNPKKSKCKVRMLYKYGNVKIPNLYRRLCSSN